MMKSILALLLIVSFCSISLGQTELTEKLPPLKMLPKKPGKVKYFYELPDSTDYTIYDQKGKLIQSGKAEFIDYTKYKPGTYFIKYDGLTKKFIRERRKRKKG